MDDSVELQEEECDKSEQLFGPSQMKANREKEHEEWTCHFYGEISGSKLFLRFIDRDTQDMQ